MRKYIKNVISVFLVIVMLMSQVQIPAATKNSGIRKVTLSMYSNYIGKKGQIEGIYRNNKFYLSVDNIGDLTGGVGKQTGKYTAEIEQDLERSFKVNVKKNEVKEIMDYGENKIPVDTMSVNGVIYLSAIEFFRYMGMTVRIDKDDDVQLKVIRKYDIYDALRDVYQQSNGYWFSWDEIESKKGTVKDKVLFAGVVALMDGDSNPFRMMIDAKGIFKDYLEDDILSIVKNEGKSYLEKEDDIDKLASYLKDQTDFNSTWYDLIMEAYGGGEYELVEGLGEKLEKGADAAHELSLICDVAENLQKYDDILASQKDLLQNTIISNANDSEVLKNDDLGILDTVKTVNTKIHNTIYKNNDTIVKTAIKEGFDIIKDKATETTNPAAIVWDGVMFIDKLLPASAKGIEDNKKLYSALYDCYLIQQISNDIFVKTYSDVFYRGFLYSNKKEQKKALQKVKDSMVMQLKSTLTIRENLMNSGKVDQSYRDDLKETNKKLAELLSKVESCKLTGPNMFDTSQTEDLSWMETEGKLQSVKTTTESSNNANKNTSDTSSINSTTADSNERSIALVLDTSSSMEGTPLDETKKAAQNFINVVGQKQAKTGIVQYNLDSEIVSGLTQNTSELSSDIDQLYAQGSTNMEAGLQDAYDLLQNSNSKKKMIVLMSDGEPNQGKQGDELIEYANELKKAGVQIYTLGFFESLADKSEQQNLLEQIASEGCHYEVDKAKDLKFFFGDIADQLNGQKYIYVKIACPVDVKVKYNNETLSTNTNEQSARTSFGTLIYQENDGTENEGDTNGSIKVLRLKDNDSYDINISGYDTGTMNYTIGFMNDDGSYDDFRTFRNIVISKTTKVDTVAKSEGDTIVNVDNDGDGKYDVRYKAGKNEEGKEFSYTIYIYIGIAAAVLLLGLTIYFTKFEKKKCKNCGHLNKAGTEHCVVCGEPLKRKKWRIFIKILLCIVLIVIGIALGIKIFDI
nr:vWA domain-containing protein [uncultured Anaerostipes sp.]